MSAYFTRIAKLVAVLLSCAASLPITLAAGPDVPFAGYDIHNTSNAAKEKKISRHNIDKVLSEQGIKWVYRTSESGDNLLEAMFAPPGLPPPSPVGDVASPVTLKGNMIYVSDQSGKIHALHANKLSKETLSVDTFLQQPYFFPFNPFAPPLYPYPKGGLIEDLPTPKVKWIAPIAEFARVDEAAPDQVVHDPSLNTDIYISQKYRAIFGQRASVTVANSDTLLIGNNGNSQTLIDPAGNPNPARLFPPGMLLPSGESTNGPTGAVLVAVNRHDGSFKWSTVIDDHPTAIMTSSPIVDRGVAYVGISTYESGLSGMFANPLTHDVVPLIFGPEYTECCSFRGSVVAVDVKSGKILWKRFTITPEDDAKAVAELDWRERPTTIQDGEHPAVSLSGSSVWGSTPVMDRQRKSIYVGTGQNHTIPDGQPGDFVNGIKDTAYCEAERVLILAGDLVVDANDVARAHDPLACVSEKNYVVTMLSLDKDSGEVNWATKLQGFDAWNSTCITPLVDLSLFGFPFPPLNLSMCPLSASAPIDRVLGRDEFYPFGPNGPLLGHDHDIGQGPMLLERVEGVKTMLDPRDPSLGYLPGERTMDLLVVGTKKGFVYALDPQSGELVWSRRVDDVDIMYKGQVINTTGFILGGLEFGSATDGKRIYTASANSLKALLPSVFNTLPDANDLDCADEIEAIYGEPPIVTVDGRDPTLDGVCPVLELASGFEGSVARIQKFNGDIIEVNSGWWSALDVRDGSIVWQTAPEEEHGQEQVLEGMVGVANGVVYGGTDPGLQACVFDMLGFFSLDNCPATGNEGYFFALDAENGEILKSFNTRRGAVYARPTISSGNIYWPTGQSRFTNLFLPGNLIYAFEAKDEDDE